MKFELAFLEEAQKEWRKLDATIWAQLNERLSERLEHPPVPASKLCCHPDRYKIKLLSVGGGWFARCGTNRYWCWLLLLARASVMRSIKPLPSGSGRAEA